MFVPWPVLIAIGVAFFALLVIAVKRGGGGRDLMAPPAVETYRAPPPPLAWDPRAPLPPEVEAELRALVREGRKIEAVKRVRETTGLGLKEALDLVERLPL